MSMWKGRDGVGWGQKDSISGWEDLPGVEDIDDTKVEYNIKFHLPYRAIKQDWILRYNWKMLAKGCQGQLTDIFSINADFA